MESLREGLRCEEASGWVITTLLDQRLWASPYKVEIPREEETRGRERDLYMMRKLSRLYRMRPAVLHEVHCKFFLPPKEVFFFLLLLLPFSDALTFKRRQSKVRLRPVDVLLFFFCRYYVLVPFLLELMTTKLIVLVKQHCKTCPTICRHVSCPDRMKVIT